MKYRIAVVAFTVLMGFCMAAGTYGAEEELPSLKEFGEKVKVLVLKYYPKAEVSITDEEIEFEYGARKFMVHDMNKMGMWLGAHETKGPKRKFFTKEDEKEPGIGKKESGIVGYIRIEPWEYVLSKVRPQTWGWTYFKVLMLAPYSKKFDCHLIVDLKYPDTVNQEFVKEFTALVNDFENYLK